MKIIRNLLLLAGLFLMFGCGSAKGPETGNVIFIHPDGTGVSNWNATRLVYYGPDGKLNWDKLPNVAVYLGHAKNSISPASHSGATMHAYGVKVDRDSYGMDKDAELTALSGKKKSILMEAMEAGLQTGIINSGTIVEPGSGVFAASDTSRREHEAIAEKIIDSGADVIMAGGEEWLIPAGSEGYHGEGRRSDGLNLIEKAKGDGYFIVYNAEELKNMPDSVTKVLGVFASRNTYNDVSEEEQAAEDLPNYNPEAPTVAEMTEAALELFSRSDRNFLLVVEEEGTDNFGNKNNAKGMLEALKNADDAIGVSQKFLEKNPETLIITAADSEAGGMEVFGEPDEFFEKYPKAPEFTDKGAPFDGVEGSETEPFTAKPDKSGKELKFFVAWSTGADVYGSVVSRAAGLNADKVRGTIDNTDVYRIMYLTLFGEWLD